MDGAGVTSRVEGSGSITAEKRKKRGVRLVWTDGLLGGVCGEVKGGLLVVLSRVVIIVEVLD